VIYLSVMSALSRLRIAWSGSAVPGGGVSTWYTEGDPLQLQLAAKAFFGGSMNTRFPSSVTVTIPTSGETIESTTGTLTGGWTAGTGFTMTGAGTGPYAAGVGTRLVWETAGITRGRRVRGSTYLVPLNGSMFDSDGTLVASIQTALAAAAQQVVVSLGDDLVVWSRNTPGNADGKAWTVSAGTCPDRTSWLRSRRT
jgi:hypothetical protein